MLKKFIFSIFMILALTAGYVQPAYAEQITPPTQPAVNAGRVKESLNTWFVQLSGKALADGGDIIALGAQQNKFQQLAAQTGAKVKVQYTYGTLWNGFAVTGDASEVNKLRRIPGVVAVFPSSNVKMPITTQSAYNPELYTALNLSGASYAQNTLHMTGKGIKVAVMDTGIDYDHPAFGGDGVARSNSTKFPTLRVFKGWDFVGDAYNADDVDPIVTPDAYPDDCAGHGTHVAGIIGANDKTNALKGVAPDVRFGAYRVFGCAGSTSDAIMLAAMERAYKDGMQVLNMSIGSPFDWPQAPTAVAASLLVSKGMVVVASIGNEGEYGLYSAGAPGVGENVIGVASYDNTKSVLPYFLVNGTKIGFLTMEFAPEPPASGTFEFVDAGLACSALDAVQRTNPAPLAGKVALIARGSCSFVTKAENAIVAGASAVVISNNAPGNFSGTLGAPLSDPTIPVVSISQEDGVIIRAQSVPVSVTFTGLTYPFPNPSAGLISSFSAYGLTPDLVLKPDIGAPGGSIYSSWPLEMGGYANLSGTSMSSPHVAGAVALLLQAKPLTRADQVRNILQNSAVPALWSLAPEYGILDGVQSQGAGMIRIDRAILASTDITPGKLSLGESITGPADNKQVGAYQNTKIQRTIKIRNMGPAQRTYRLSYENAITAAGTITPSFFIPDTTVKFSTSKFLLKPKKYLDVTVTFTPSSVGPTPAIYGGYIIVTQDDGKVYRVPYGGFIGNYQAISVLDNAMGLPQVLDINENPKSTFNLSTWLEVPFVYFHVEHQARIVKIDVVDSVTGVSAGNIFNYDYMFRNSSEDGYFAVYCDGTVINGGSSTDLPDGNYRMKISVLKALGKSSNPADWEYWTSDPFTIAR